MTDRKEIAWDNKFKLHMEEFSQKFNPEMQRMEKSGSWLMKLWFYAGYDARNAEVEELKDRLTHEVEMIQGAASDEIERLNKELNNPLIQYKADRMLMDKYEELGNAHVKLVAENLKLRELVGV